MQHYNVELSNGETMFLVPADSTEEAMRSAVFAWGQRYGEVVTATWAQKSGTAVDVALVFEAAITEENRRADAGCTPGLSRVRALRLRVARGVFGELAEAARRVVMGDQASLHENLRLLETALQRAEGVQ